MSGLYRICPDCDGTHERLTSCGSFDFCGNESPCVVPATVEDLPPEAIKRAARAWAETIVGGAEVDQLAVDPLASKQALQILRAALGGTGHE